MGTPLFLVLAGGPRTRRLHSTASLFGDADEAAAEFRRVADRLAAKGGWVELASVDEGGRLDRLLRSGGQAREVPAPAAQAATSRSASVA